MLLPRALHLLCAETFLLVDLEILQRLSGRLGVRILHAHCSDHRLIFAQYTTCSTRRCLVAQSLCGSVVRRDMSVLEMSRLASRRYLRL